MRKVDLAIVWKLPITWSRYADHLQHSISERIPCLEQHKQSSRPALGSHEMSLAWCKGKEDKLQWATGIQNYTGIQTKKCVSFGQCCTLIVLSHTHSPVKVLLKDKLIKIFLKMTYHCICKCGICRQNLCFSQIQLS